MSMEGQGNSQPSDGALTLNGLADAMDFEDESELDESEDDEDSDDPEVEEAEDDDEDDDAPESDETDTITHDGKDVTLTKAEIKQLAQQGFDYTQKTMKVAEERKAVEAERAQASQHREQYERVASESFDRLNAYISFMESEIGAPPSIELAAHDSTTYLIQKEQYEERKGKYQQALSERQQLANEHARHRQAWVEQRAAETEKALRDTLPDWKDDSIDALAAYAGKLGLTPNSVPDSLLEPGFWLLADKAMKYDALQAQKATMTPVKKVPKAMKPVAGNQPPQLAKHAERVKTFRSKPSLNTLADLL